MHKQSKVGVPIESPSGVPSGADPQRMRRARAVGRRRHAGIEVPAHRFAVHPELAGDGGDAEPLPLQIVDHDISIICLPLPFRACRWDVLTAADLRGHAPRKSARRRSDWGLFKRHFWGDYARHSHGALLCLRPATQRRLLRARLSGGHRRGLGFAGETRVREGGVDGVYQPAMNIQHVRLWITVRTDEPMVMNGETYGHRRHSFGSTG